MNRRSFLKVAGLSVAAAPVILSDEYTKQMERSKQEPLPRAAANQSMTAARWNQTLDRIDEMFFAR